MVQRARRNGYRGEANHQPIASNLSDAVPENGLMSVYLSPVSVSAVIHVVRDDALACRPGAHTGRLVARPEEPVATCPGCLFMEGNRNGK